MLHGQRALWSGYPCSNGKLPFSHCQGNIAESTKLEVTATLVYLFSFSFFSTQQQIYTIRWRSSSDDRDKYDDNQEQSIEIIQSMIESNFFTCNYYFLRHVESKFIILFSYETSLCQIKKSWFFSLDFITLIDVDNLLFSSIVSDWNKS